MRVKIYTKHEWGADLPLFKKTAAIFLIVLLSFFSFNLYAQNKPVKGRVIDERGQGIAGATVRVKGVKSGTITDADGGFQISSLGSAILQISSVGYVAQDLPVNNRTNVTVTLVLEPKSLSDVIVVGYGSQRKEAVTGSVASISGAKLNEVPSANIAQALQGRVAGVELAQTSTKPGATMQIRIRGTRSINASNDPLIVLDGIPFGGTIADISPDDIKSVDILKDASATAIYGSRGANGVILITTKKGNTGQEPQVAYSGYYGAKDVMKYPMMQSGKYLALRKRAGLNKNPGADEDTTGNTNTDWQHLFYRPAAVTNHDVSVTGGTNKGSYKFGVGYYRDEAPVPLSQYNRISLRGSLDQGIGKLFRVGFTTNNSYSITDGSSIGMYGVLSMSPLANPFNADGSTKRVVTMPQDIQWVQTRKTMDALGDQYANRTKEFASYNSLYGEMKIPGVEGLKYRLNLGGNIRTSFNGSYTGVGVFSSDPANPNVASTTNSLTTQWTVENLLFYDKTFAQKHTINVTALYSSEQVNYNNQSISRRNLAGDTFQYYNLGQTSTGSNDDITIDPNNQAYTQSGLMSYMGRIMYSYDDRYMLSATFRSDASSRLAAGHKWHSYPAISAGWNISRESFMKDVNWVTSLKLRAGYGQTSNQSVAPYATLGQLSVRPYNFGTTNANGYYVTVLPNPQLGWEYSKTKNLGLDFSLFNSRLSGTVEGYVTNTNNLLLSVGLPSTSGVSSYTGNVGSTQNKGFEISLNGTIISNNNGWSWDLGVNLYRNVNKVVSLASGQTRDESNWLFVGHPLNVIFDYKKVGIWQANEATAVKQYEGSGGQAGMIKVLYTGGYNADGSPSRIIGSDDRQIMDADPKFQGGFNSRVAYKAIDLTIVGAFVSGGILNSTLYGSNGYLNLEDGRRGQIDINYWTPDNPGAQFPDPNGPKNSNNPKYGSTLGYFDGSYLKIRAITLGYNFSGKWMNHIGMKRLRVYATAQNPFVFFSPYYKQSGMDPEPNSFANDGANMAVAYGSGQRRLLTVGYNTPNTRNYLVGLNVSF
ncbi:TonB-linked outer membrane protein, SusC/RagA family [Mucilaginibacter gossypiicola]|uniref:TonB-linked outer membrane protein, SusC/RagA family n=1 Tax=Mucilaginibacter gossypiicola TaxID=551995 RepID=A0A1H8NVW8_9SPHI|nr:TonB-dependent receptor [Mucilaginibacter gossypiicola]SEO33825.1 TonB-linked outer membrane protein, SusC/RagA family [Mucilaginibacter gossypiicola]